MESRCPSPSTVPSGIFKHEGMRFAVRADGRYQVGFGAAKPAMPLTPWLHLIRADEHARNQDALTLPPISAPEKQGPKRLINRQPVQPDYADCGTVHHKGFSPVLAANASNIRVGRRLGRARFGFGVDIP